MIYFHSINDYNEIEGKTEIKIENDINKIYEFQEDRINNANQEDEK